MSISGPVTECSPDPRLVEDLVVLGERAVLWLLQQVRRELREGRR